jgi:hypothetical protein
MTRRRRAHLLAFCITAVIMCNTIIHLFTDVRPFDWLMFGLELAVLIAILAFEIRAVRREQRQDRDQRGRKTVIDSVVAAMQNSMSQGQHLINSQPLPNPQDALELWVQGVKEWTANTSAMLRSYSPRAELAFLHHPTIVPNVYGSNPRPFIYGPLEHRLNNLRNIMERPEAYF